MRVEAVGRVVDRPAVAEVGVAAGRARAAWPPCCSRAPRASHGWLWGTVLCRSAAPPVAASDPASSFRRVSSATRLIMACLNLFVEQPRRAASARGRASARRDSARGRRAAAAPPRRPAPTARGRSAPGRASRSRLRAGRSTAARPAAIRSPSSPGAPSGGMSIEPPRHRVALDRPQVAASAASSASRGSPPQRRAGGTPAAGPSARTVSRSTSASSSAPRSSKWR